LEKFDGNLFCPGNSKKQINQFKRMIAKDNLPAVNKSDRYLQMRKISGSEDSYSLDIFYKKEKVGHFYVKISEPAKLTEKIYSTINEQSEKMFREESVYGIKDLAGLDRANNSIYGGFGNYEPYPTITSKAAGLWYKLATSQFFNNGNKRTAMLAAIYLLNINFYSFDVFDGNYMYDLSLQAANQEINAKYIERFINKHVSLNYENMANALENGNIDFSIPIVFNNTK